MLLQTNSYLVPKDKRAEHARLVRRFRQLMARYGCEHFEVYEQIGTDWNAAKVTGRFVQMMRFRDRQHHMEVQEAERRDPAAQELIEEFCQLLNIPYQREQGLFAVGFYQSALPCENERAWAPAPAATAETPLVADGPPPAEPEPSPQSPGLEAEGLDSEAPAEESAPSTLQPEPESSAGEHPVNAADEVPKAPATGSTPDADSAAEERPPAKATQE